MEESVCYRVALQQTLRDYENFSALHERVGKGSVNLINRISNLVLKALAVIMPLCALKLTPDSTCAFL